MAAQQRIIGRRGRRTNNVSMDSRNVGKGQVFIEMADGALLEIVNPNNPAELVGVETRKLTGEQAQRQRRRFLRGRAGKVAGRGKTVPRSRVQASQIEDIRRRDRTQRDEEWERRTTMRHSLGRSLP